MNSVLHGNDLVGYTTPWHEHELDARWAMAYAAALGDLRAAYFDNTHDRALAVHPVFPVCLEWPALVASLCANGVDMHRTVHATHDLHLLRPLVPPMQLRTRGRIIGVEQRKPGVYLMWRFDTVDSSDADVCQTWQGNLFLGATLSGDAVWQETPPPPPPTPPISTAATRTVLSLPGNLSHVYTECARIFNPLHTDAAVAAAAGIAQPILHGTATLALAISALLDAAPGGDPRPLRRLGGRFAAMVTVPSQLTLSAWRANDNLFGFETVNEAGARAIRDGYVCF